MDDHVTIGVPIYRGEAFLEETLRAIQRQTHHNFTAILSVDGPDRACEAICGKFLGDTRFQLHKNGQRAGWVDNINRCMAHVKTGFWCFQQQDDLIDETYLETLLAHADAHPEAALVYCDIETIGNTDNTIDPVPSVIGDTAFARQMAMLHEHLVAAAFRGLTKASAVREAGAIPRNDCRDFGVDTAWLAGVARAGELHRVPQTLYQKRFHGKNTSADWFTRPRAERLETWCAHCVDMVNQALGIWCSAPESRLLWLAGLERLTSLNTARTFLGLGGLRPDEYAAMLQIFLDRMEASDVHHLPALLDLPWPGIRKMAEAYFWIPTKLPVEIVDYGPQPVIAGTPFNVQPDGSSALWVRTNRSIAPGSRYRLRLGGTDLETAVRNRILTACVPAQVTREAVDLPMQLVTDEGAPCSAPVLFRVAPADTEI